MFNMRRASSSNGVGVGSGLLGVFMVTKKRGFDHRLATLIFTKDQLAALGSVVVESTACEEYVESLIWNLAKLDENQGKHFTSSMQMNSRLEMLSTLGKPLLRSEKKRNELTQLISKLKTVNAARNVVVHGNWQTNGIGVLTVISDGAENHPPAIVRKRRLNSAPITNTAAQIKEIALDIAELTSELMDFARSWRRVPSLKKSLQQAIAPQQNPVQKPPKSQAKTRPPPP